MKIKFTKVNDISSFINGIQFFKGKVMLEQGDQKINANSILGIYSLDFSTPIKVSITTNNKGVEEDFYKYMKIWEKKDDKS